MRLSNDMSRIPLDAPRLRMTALATGGFQLLAGPGIANSLRLVRDSPQWGQRWPGFGSRIQVGGPETSTGGCGSRGRFCIIGITCFHSYTRDSQTSLRPLQNNVLGDFNEMICEPAFLSHK